MASFLMQEFECIIVDIEKANPRFLKIQSLADYKSFRNKIKATVINNASIREGKVVNILRILKHFFIFDIFNPINIYQFLYILFKLRGNSFNYIFASSPPFSSALLAFFLKKKFNKARLIVDFRDQWANHPFLPSKTIFNKNTIQNYILSETTHVITVSNYIKDSIHKHNVKVIFNAPDINYPELNSSIKNNDKINFIYTGSLPKNFYDYKKTKRILDLINDEYSNDFNFLFVGACYELEKEKCPINVSFFNQTSLSNSREMQFMSDALLFIAAIGHLNSGVVSSKIFEYIQSGKPILPLFVQEGSDVYYIIKESCGWCPCINTEEQILGLIKNIKNVGVYKALPNLKNKHFLENLLNSYTQFVEKLS